MALASRWAERMVRATYVLLGSSNSLDLSLFIYCPKAVVDKGPTLTISLRRQWHRGGALLRLPVGGALLRHVYAWRPILLILLKR